MTEISVKTPAKILQLGTAFWGSKTLLSAIELGVFTLLAVRGPQTLTQLRESLELHPRSAEDFLDALVALGMLQRHDGRYCNTSESELYLDRTKPSYVGGVLEMLNARLYGYWGNLTEALQTGAPQNEMRAGGADLFAAIYTDPARLEQFLGAMTGISLPTARAIASAFPWAEHKSFADLGCAQGGLGVEIALAHKHLSGIGFDLTPVGPVFSRYVAQKGLASRLRFQAGDFFKDALPPADVLVMGHILHDWGLADKKRLLKKAYDALPQGGALIVYDAMIDDARRENAFGLLMSLNMLIETRDGFDYTGADCAGWMRDAGFRNVRVEAVQGPYSMAVGRK